MSLAHKSCVSQLEAVESQIRCTKGILTWNGVKLSPRNEEFVMDLYTIMSCLWFDVSLSPGLLNPRWVTHLMSEPVDQLVAFLKDLDFFLISERNISEASFNHWRKATYPRMGQILAPLKENCIQFIKTGVGLQELRTALRHITRANFPDPLGQEEEAFAKWQEVCLKPDATVDVSGEAAILASIFPRRRSVAQLDGFRPKFGPGASYGLEDRSLLDKYLDFSSDSMLDYIGHKVDFPPTDMPRCKVGNLQRIHRVHFVPKQLDKLRVVSMEPCSLMFYQLGIMDHMMDCIRRSQWRNHIDLNDAEKNKELAWEGSLTGEYATIDLSSASDSVRLWHVKSMFKDTCLREMLLGTRSRQAEYNGVLYTPTYFAPMGSGTCFPVECAVFASVVDRVMRQHRDGRAWRVYGDDIICPSDRAEEVINRLTELGFLVNVEKSFFSTAPGFRESCGGDYYLGEDVRPNYVSRKWAGLHPSPRHPSEIVGLIDTANSLYKFKYARLRTIKALLQVKPGVQFDANGENGIFSLSPTNWHLKSRWNQDYQRTEYLAGALSTSRDSSSMGYEDIRLFEFLRAAEARGPLLSESTTSISRVNRLKWSAKWQSPAPGWQVEKG